MSSSEFKKGLLDAFAREHGIVLPETMLESVWVSSGMPLSFSGRLEECNCFECFREMFQVLKRSRKPMHMLRACRSIDRYFGDTRLMDALLFGYADRHLDIDAFNIKASVESVYHVSSSEANKIIANALAFWDNERPVLRWFAPCEVPANAAGWILALSRDFMEAWNVSLDHALCLRVLNETFECSLEITEEALYCAEEHKGAVLKDARITSSDTAERLLACVGGAACMSIEIVRLLDSYFGAHKLENCCILKKCYWRATRDLSELVAEAYGISLSEAVAALGTVVLFRSPALQGDLPIVVGEAAIAAVASVTEVTGSNAAHCR